MAHSHHALVVEGDAGDSLTLLDYDPDGAGGVDPQFTIPGNGRREKRQESTAGSEAIAQNRSLWTMSA